jgi:ABC-type transport system involved in multi-copper enzyme maturation permease subunit
MNPIIQRELVGFLRTWKAVGMLVTVAAAFALVVMLRWPTEPVRAMSGAESDNLFRLFGYGLLATVLLMSPVLPATSIVRERVSGTLTLLINSPMPNWQIFTGKLWGSLGFAFLLLTMSLPAATACYAMGGIDVWQIFVLYALLCLTCVQMTTVALFVSSHVGSTDGALRSTYGAVLAISILALGPFHFFRSIAPEVEFIARLMRCISPIPAMRELMGHLQSGMATMEGETGLLPKYIVAAHISSILFGYLTIRRMNHRALDRSRSQGVMTHQRSGADQWARRFLYLVDPNRRAIGILPGVNPVMIKEFRCRKFGRSHWLIRLMMGSAVTSLLLTVLTVNESMEQGVGRIAGLLAIMQFCLVVLITPSLASSMISAERESGGWVLLQTTRLSGGAILRGKFMSVIWTLLLVVASTTPGYFMMVYLQPDLWLSISRVAISLGLACVFSLAVSAFVSCIFRRAAASTTAAYGILFVIYAGSILVWLGRDAPFGHDVVEFALRLNLLAAALNILEVQGFTQYDIVSESWWIAGVTSAVLYLFVIVRTQLLLRPQ